MGESSKAHAAPPTDAGDIEAAQSFLGDAVIPPADPADLPPRPPTEVVPPPGPPAGPGEVQATQSFLGGDAVTRFGPADGAEPPGRPPTEVVRLGPPDEVVRYGPGVPAALPGGHAERTAEQVWRSGQQSSSPARRRPRLLRPLGSALTVILLAASGVVLYLRFHHAPFRVTGVAISQRTRTGCGVDVTGRITTNGAPGTVTYQWLFVPGQQPPRPWRESVTAGQHAVYVTVAVEGSGHGSARQTVTLQVLGPDPRIASAAAVVSC